MTDTWREREVKLYKNIKFLSRINKLYPKTVAFEFRALIMYLDSINHDIVTIEADKDPFFIHVSTNKSSCLMDHNGYVSIIRFDLG